MGLCQYADLCFHASSLPCLHTFWHAIPTSFYIFNVFYLLIYIYTLLHELACNIASYCMSGCGIFTSRRRVKMQPTSAIIAMCMLTSVINVYYPSQIIVLTVSPPDRKLTEHPPSASILIRAYHGCYDSQLHNTHSYHFKQEILDFYILLLSRVLSQG